MRTMRLAPALAATALMVCAWSTPSVAQNSHQHAPSIRIYSSNGAAVVNTTTYIQPEISLSENAYVFVVSMDLDGQIQVLHPDFPGLSVKISAHTHLQLKNFFVGFNQPAPNGSAYSTARRAYDGDYVDTRGTVIALASRAPFSFDAISSGGDWNMLALRQLLESRTPEEAMNMLADYLGAKGEPIGGDFMRFAGGSANAYAYDDYGYGYYDAYYSPCDLYYGYFASPGLGFAQLQALNSVNRARAGGQKARVVGFDLCGLPIVSYGPPAAIGQFPNTARPPRNQGDTTVFPKARFNPRAIPRHPAETSVADLNSPPPHRAGVGNMDDVTITAPTGRRGEPREIYQGYRPMPSTMSIPQGRMPVERTITRSEPVAASGSMPAPVYRAAPPVQSSPPPARVPDRTAAPAPVVHERPPTPAPPPPRAENPSKPSGN